MHAVFVSSYLAVQFPQTPVMGTLLWTLSGASCTGLYSSSVRSCVVILGCTVPTDACGVDAAMDTVGWEWYTCICASFKQLWRRCCLHCCGQCRMKAALVHKVWAAAVKGCGILLGFTLLTGDCLADTVVDTVG